MIFSARIFSSSAKARLIFLAMLAGQGERIKT